MDHQKQPEWTYQLTENLIRPLDKQHRQYGQYQHQLNPSILVSSLPSNATVFRHPNSSDADASFGQYIDNQFHGQAAAVLKSRLPEGGHDQPVVGTLGPGQGTSNNNNHHSDQTATKVTVEPVVATATATTSTGLNPVEPLPTQPPAVDTFWKTLAEDLQQHRPKQYNMDYYNHHHQSGPIDEKLPWWVAPNDDNEDGFYSVGALLFLFGFICPPLWWLGSFWPRQAREQGGKMAERWQKLNRYMSIGFSIILIIAIIVTAAMLSRK
ncbi:hypothetical protein DFQ28_005467 [Apophysomyces sp. BC1034]|nr:hypothetical protein DFQ29_004506 [Apophysomyces sp. BC1021]KAG0188039.1 hypothetical protein DFQ28_005467 [Apophysomyces sp. BC1034]